MRTHLPPLSQRTTAADGKLSLLILDNGAYIEQRAVCSIKEKKQWAIKLHLECVTGIASGTYLPWN